MYHLLICPALSREHIQLNEELNHKLRGWSVPYSAIKPSSRESQLRTKWYHAARRIFPFEEISDSRLSLLTKGFWKSNQYKQCISTRAFMENLRTYSGTVQMRARVFRYYLVRSPREMSY